MAHKKSFKKEELKMPKEQFGVTNHEDGPSYLGIILGVLIIILICILGGLYMWSEILKKNEIQQIVPESTRPTAEKNNEPESTNAEAEVETLNALSPSNELGAIEADLGSTIITDPEVDLTAVETELKAE